MSYLDLPRLVFAGRFQADPSTVNNTPQNFNTAAFTREDVVASQDGGGGGWNPQGTGAWRFEGCTVRSLTYLDGTVITPGGGASDPILGAPVNGSDDKVSGKIVDLDSEQQMVSEIWGFQVRLGRLSQPDAFAGDYLVSSFFDLWLRGLGQGGGGGDGPMGAAYQSVIANVRWSEVLTSRFLEELRGVSPSALSIKFALDGFNMDRKSADFTFGRIVGAIGPAFPGEPKKFVAGRLMRPTTGDSNNSVGSPPMYFAPFKVDEKKKQVIVDLGNSLPTSTPGGPLTDLGQLQVAIIQPNGAAPLPLGAIDYLASPSWYTQTASIVTCSITDEQLDQIRTTPLGVIQALDPSQPTYNGLPYGVLIQENASGALLRTDDSVFRLYPGGTAAVDFWALRFGRPAPGETVHLRLDALLVNNKQNPFNPYDLPTGVPAAALELPATVRTDQDGRAQVTLTAHDPGHPRKFIDGQVYGVAYTWAPAMWPGYNANPWNFISVLVWDRYDANAEPTWWGDIQPIFRQYADLYPVMGQILDLGEYQSVKKHRGILRLAFGLPHNDPNYMPPTRDLSPAKQATILRWLDDPDLPEGVKSSV